MTAKDSPAASQIDAYLATLPEAMRTALEELRRTISTAAPDAEAVIGYGVPAFRYRGRPLVSFGATRTHGSFYVQSPAVMDAHRSELEGYRTAKGTVHFVPGTPLPERLVTALVRARMAETDAAKQ